MTTEQKDLLLKDLCVRLPYRVKAYVKNWSKLDRKYYEGTYTVASIHPSLNDILVTSDKFSVEVILGYDDYEIKPYLFPLDSMTGEQIYELRDILGDDFEIDKYGIIDLIRNRRTSLSYLELDAMFEYFHKNYLDYRGLIKKDLALDATGLNIY